MNIKPLFNNAKEINIVSYLEKCGVENVDEFLKPTKESFDKALDYDNMDKAVECLRKNIGNGKSIAIVVDVDLDGYTSAAILYKCLKLLRSNNRIVFLFHKNRIHGLNDTQIMNDIKKLKPCIVFCPDSGSGDIKQHNELYNLGIDVICLDHHPTDIVSQNAIVVNNQLSPRIRNKSGSGCLVTWKFIQAYDKDTKIMTSLHSSFFAPLVYLSIIGDVCDMRSIENRLISQRANILNHSLLRKLAEKYIKNCVIDNTSIAWNICPKLSAIIRANNKSGKELMKALVDSSDIISDRVVGLAAAAHNEQKKYVSAEYDAVVNNVDGDSNLVIGDGGQINPYYRGLVASKISTLYNKPTMLYVKEGDEYTASIRSPIGLKTLLSKHKEEFNWLGGHEAAFGVGFSDLEKVIELGKKIPLESTYDVMLRCNNTLEITRNMFGMSEVYSSLWGQGIPSPTIGLQNIAIDIFDIKFIGRNERTMRFVYGDITFLMFNITNDLKDKIKNKTDNIHIDIICTLCYNNFNNRVTQQGIIKKIELN